MGLLLPAPTISLSMGEKGQITRLLSNKFGGYLTFAALSPEKASAPGQPTIQQLDTLYNFKRQSQVGGLRGAGPYLTRRGALGLSLSAR